MNIEITEAQFIAEVIATVRKAQYEASKAVNVHLINLYWELGKSMRKNKL